MLKGYVYLLQRSLQNWEDYEAARRDLNDFLRRAEIEANRTSAPGGQEVIEKELTAKEQLLSSVEGFHPQVEKLISLTPELAQGASETRQQELEQELASVQDRVGVLTETLTERTGTLRELRDNWVQFYGSSDEFSSWLGDQQKALQSLHQSELTPDEQLVKAEEICQEIMAHQSTLEGVEEQCQELTAGLRSRETTAANTKVKGMRRQFEQLTNQAREQSTSLSSDVDLWKDYEEKLGELMPWLDQAEQALQEEVGHTASLEEANEQFEQHQVRLIMSRLMNDLMRELVELKLCCEAII